MKALSLALAMLFVTGVSYASTVDLVILAGQSNMVGQAVAGGSLPGSAPEDASVRYYYDVTNTGGSFADSSGGGFGPLQPWSRTATDLRFGPEMSLGRRLVQEGYNPALLKVAIGGSDIARWQPGAIDYNRLRSAVIDGVGDLIAEGNDVNLLGLAWLQGESDVINTARADAYASRLDTFLATFRSQLETDLPGIGFATSPVFLIEPADWKNGSNPSIATSANIAKVEAALSDFAAADPLAEYLSTSDFTTFGDGLIHFGPADQLTLGDRIADAVIRSAIPEPSAALLMLGGFGFLSRRY